MRFVSYCVGVLLLIGVSVAVGMTLARLNTLPYRAFVTVTRMVIGIDADRQRPAAQYYYRRVDQFDRLPAGADILMVGDSIVEQGEWNELLAPFTVHNRGIGNDTIFGVMTRFASECRGHYTATVLQIGVNDAFAGILKSDFAARYQAVLDRLRPCTDHLIAQTIIIPARGEALVRLVQSYNQDIVTAAQAAGADIIDLNPILAKDGVLSVEFTDDWLHLNGS